MTHFIIMYLSLNESFYLNLLARLIHIIYTAHAAHPRSPSQPYKRKKSQNQPQA